jgi:hypothetical protein
MHVGAYAMDDERSSAVKFNGPNRIFERTNILLILKCSLDLEILEVRQDEHDF